MGTWIPALISGAFTVVVAIIEARAAKERKTEKLAREEAAKEREHTKAVDNGVLALLRDRIIERYNHYMEKEYIPIYGMENVLDMYEAYHALGGNGTVTKLIEALRKLHTEPQEE